MAYQKNLLLRTSITDSGDLSQHGSYCSSPDIIMHSLVNDPQGEFSRTYSSDPSQRINKSSMTNPIYTRVKSMQPSPGPITGYLRLYRASMSLFMNTDQWKENKLITPQGKEYVTVKTQKSGEIIVGDDIFTIDGTKPNFCIVGIINDSTEETLPQVFGSYNDFIMWVHSERCVAVRNFSLEQSGSRNDYEILYHMTNPEGIDRLGTVLVQASNLPAGTVYGLVNDALGMNKSTSFDPVDPVKQQVTDSAYLHSAFDGYVKIFARLPDGSRWPANAKLESTFWIGAEDREQMICFARPANEVLMDLSMLERHSKPGRLVKVGSCTTLYA